MGKESFVDGEETLGADRLHEAVDDSLVEVAVLVVEAGHDGVCAMNGVSHVIRGCIRRERWEGKREEAFLSK